MLFACAVFFAEFRVAGLPFGEIGPRVEFGFLPLVEVADGSLVAHDSRIYFASLPFGRLRGLLPRIGGRSVCSYCSHNGMVVKKLKTKWGNYHFWAC